MRSAAVFSSRYRTNLRASMGTVGGLLPRRYGARRRASREPGRGERERARPAPRRCDPRGARHAPRRARPALVLPGDFVPLVVH